MLRTFIVLLVLLAVGRSAGGAEPEPIDPGIRGEWLAFAWLDLRPLSGGGGGSARAAAVEPLRGAALVGIGAFGPVSADDERVIDEAANAAANGSVVAVWLVPTTPGENAGVNARVWSDDGSSRDIGIVLPVGDHRLSAAAGVLGPEGFAEWPAHRRAVAGATSSSPAGPIVAELALNADAIRHQCPGEFASIGARGQRLLASVGVANARVIGFHVRLIPAVSVPPRDPSLPRIGGAFGAEYAGPPLAVVEASWSARSQPPGTVHHATLTLPYWPVAQLGSGGGDGAFVVAGRAAWRPMAERVIGVYAATVPDPERPGVEDSLTKWKASHGGALGRLLGGLGPWVAWTCPVGGEDRGRLVWRIPLRPDASAESAAGLLGEVTAGVGEAGASSRWGGRGGGPRLKWGVESDSPAAVWGSIGFGALPASKSTAQPG